MCLYFCRCRHLPMRSVYHVLKRCVWQSPTLDLWRKYWLDRRQMSQIVQLSSPIRHQHRIIIITFPFSVTSFHRIITSENRPNQANEAPPPPPPPSSLPSLARIDSSNTREESDEHRIEVKVSSINRSWDTYYFMIYLISVTNRSQCANLFRSLTRLLSLLVEKKTAFHLI